MGSRERVVMGLASRAVSALVIKHGTILVKHVIRLDNLWNISCFGKSY